MTIEKRRGVNRAFFVGFISPGFQPEDKMQVIRIDKPF
jgi:hypothetical protein